MPCCYADKGEKANKKKLRKVESIWWILTSGSLSFVRVQTHCTLFPEFLSRDIENACFQHICADADVASNKKMRMNNVCDHPWMVPS